MNDVLRPQEQKANRSLAESLDLQYETVPLPSKGVFYKDGTLAGKDSLEVGYLTAAQEDILTSPNLLQSGKLLDVLLKSVIKDKSVNPSELLLGDRNSILVWLRSTGFGHEYEVSMVCRKCGEDYENTFDLSELDYQELEEMPDENLLYTFKLPKSGAEIKFRLLTAGDESEILNIVKSLQKKTKTKIDNTSTLRMAKSIVSVNGSQDQTAINKLSTSMPMQDAKAFNNYVASVEPGIILKQVCVCPHCEHESEEAVPIRSGFLWPES